MTVVMNDDTWFASARCRGMDPEVFVADETREFARSVCRDCDVQGACLEYGLAHVVLIGIWGGTDDPERRRLRRANRAAISQGENRIVPSPPPSVCPGCRLTGAIMPVGGGSLECGTCGARWPGSFT